MKSIKFNDWQEMALKKDTETIIKKLNKQEFSTINHLIVTCCPLIPKIKTREYFYIKRYVIITTNP